jgi:Protein of unknown function (DUF1275)
MELFRGDANRYRLSSWGRKADISGNTVYTGLGVSGQPASQPYRWTKSGTSIIGFCIGTYFFSRLARALGPMRRGTMCLLSIIQAILCFISATLVLTGVVAEDAGSQIPKNCIVLLPLAMLAFNSAGQIVQSRFLGFSEIPTVVLTSTYCDLMFDPLLFTSPLTVNSKRNRRLLSAVALLLGAMLGGFLTQHGKIENAIWIAGGVKVIMAVVWIFWSSEGSIRLD